MSVVWCAMHYGGKINENFTDTLKCFRIIYYHGLLCTTFLPLSFIRDTSA